jgi:hypothetical protein
LQSLDLSCQSIESAREAQLITKCVPSPKWRAIPNIIMPEQDSGPYRRIIFCDVDMIVAARERILIASAAGNVG